MNYNDSINEMTQMIKRGEWIQSCTDCKTYFLQTWPTSIHYCYRCNKIHCLSCLKLKNIRIIDKQKNVSYCYRCFR